MKWHVRKVLYLTAIPVLTLMNSLSARDANCSLDWGCEPPNCANYESCSWWLRGDVLYWKARGSNINYLADYNREAISVGNALDSTIQNYAVKTKSVDFDRDFGFRLGIGYKKPCSCWDYGFMWTHFCTDAKGSPGKCHSCAGQLGDESVFKANTKWHLHLNFWDFEAGRLFCVGDCFTVRPRVSIRGATLKQDYDSYSSFLIETLNVQNSVSIQRGILNEVVSDDIYDIKEKHNFYGAGPRAGVDLNWLLGCGWSLYADLAAAFLVGYSENNVCDRIQLFSNNDVFDIDFEQLFERDERNQANRVIADLGGGIRWKPRMCECCYNLVFQLGWEYHAIFGQKHAYFGREAIIVDPFKSEFELERNTGPCKSTLAVYGLTFSTMLEF